MDTSRPIPHDYTKFAACAEEVLIENAMGILEPTNYKAPVRLRPNNVSRGLSESRHINIDLGRSVESIYDETENVYIARC